MHRCWTHGEEGVDWPRVPIRMVRAPSFEEAFSRVPIRNLLMKITMRLATTSDSISQGHIDTAAVSNRRGWKETLV